MVVRWRNDFFKSTKRQSRCSRASRHHHLGNAHARSRFQAVGTGGVLSARNLVYQLVQSQIDYPGEAPGQSSSIARPPTPFGWNQ